MKKIFITLLVLIVPFIMVGCQKNVTLENSMSEITRIYFVAENDGINANISVGEREEEYIIDGKHTKNCDFSLIAIKFESLLTQNQIEVNLIINNTSSQLVLDLNPANHFYMTDLGYALNDTDNILITYKNFNLSFENVSKGFGIDYKEALTIAERHLGDKMNKFYNRNNFVGEGYLKVLTGQDEKNESLFWVLTIVGKNNYKNNVVLSVKNGRVIVSE